MDDQPRFAVALTRAVDPQVIAAAAPQIAAATGSDTAKVATLLRRGPGRLTKGLPQHEATDAARIFTEAGVEVDVVRFDGPSHSAATPVPPARSSTADPDPPAVVPQYGRPTLAPTARSAGPGPHPSRDWLSTGRRAYLLIGIVAVAVLAFAAGRFVSPTPGVTPTPTVPLEAAAIEPGDATTEPPETSSSAANGVGDTRAHATEPEGTHTAAAVVETSAPASPRDSATPSQKQPQPSAPAPAPARSSTPAAVHPDDTAVFSYVPFEQLVGARFIFLEKPASVQHYGYQLVRRTRERQYSGDYRVSYQEAVGRVGRVVAIERDVVVHLVQLEMEDSGQTYFVEAYLNSMSDLGPVADIEHAKRLYQGTTLWLRRRTPFTYDPSAASFGTVDARPFSPVRVADVVPGWYDHAPARFVLETPTGERGYIDVNMTGTNVGDILFDGSRFDDYFFVQDPRVLYPWSDRVWSAIEDQSVFIGMTANQARLAWGTPTSVNRTTTRSGTREQWVYGGGNYLYFQDGILETIQN